MMSLSTINTLAALAFYAAVCMISAPAWAENKANDYLLSLSPKERAKMLGKVVGDGCVGKTAFYMGSKDEIKPEKPNPHDLPPLAGHDHDAYWSLRCRDGRSYQVAIFPDGNGGVLDCKALKAITAVSCFRKLSDQ